MVVVGWVDKARAETDRVFIIAIFVAAFAQNLRFDLFVALLVAFVVVVILATARVRSINNRSYVRQMDRAKPRHKPAIVP